jgi:hypothetical protein
MRGGMVLGMMYTDEKQLIKWTFSQGRSEEEERAGGRGEEAQGARGDQGAGKIGFLVCSFMEITQKSSKKLSFSGFRAQPVFKPFSKPPIFFP